ncbi:hypothetical protein [Sphingobium fuliginis]|uniref:Uncharacterized protein n=1 Tax=Sphingobium lactosutens DS20 TaxID=1331060 RepID=T0HUK6_9SPHN|nr:hypothetical protein [Sphingobium fuliginis]EQB16792.1 hypothetical protein RLDS_06650 [Sphingobium lactosutens DS20]
MRGKGAKIRLSRESELPILICAGADEDPDRLMVARIEKPSSPGTTESAGTAAQG